MKKLIIIVLLGILTMLTGCNELGEGSEGTKEAANKSSIKKNSLIIDGLKISVTNKEKNQKKQNVETIPVYTYTIEAENVSSLKKGLGSFEFVLLTKDKKEYAYDDTLAIFGNEIEPGKRMKGKVSFSLSKGSEPFELLYKPSEKVLASWKVT